MAHTKGKISPHDIFNCDDMSAFVASIIRVLHYPGMSMSQFYTCRVNNVKFLTKLCFYKKSQAELYGASTPGTLPQTETEIRILEILKRDVVDANISQCIVEIVYSKTCDHIPRAITSAAKCAELVKATTRSIADEFTYSMCKYVDMVAQGLAYNKCAFVVLDTCDITLDFYLQHVMKNSDRFSLFKSILFQIIYTLCAITTIYPGFRHYDLHTDNVMLKFDRTYTFKAADPKFLVFTIDNVAHTIPRFGLIPKIIDFGYSVLPEKNIVSNNTSDRTQMYHRIDNDVIVLFHWINMVITRARVDPRKLITKLLKKLEPTGSYINYDVYYMRTMKDKIPSYAQMLKNPVWDEYRKKSVSAAQVDIMFTPIVTKKI